VAYGAIGGVVLVDTERLNQCFAAVDYFEQCAMPFLVAVSCFDGTPVYEPAEVKAALDLDPGHASDPVRRTTARVRQGSAGRPGLARAPRDPREPLEPLASAMQTMRTRGSQLTAYGRGIE